LANGSQRRGWLWGNARFGGIPRAGVEGALTCMRDTFWMQPRNPINSLLASRAWSNRSQPTNRAQGDPHDHICALDPFNDTTTLAQWPVCQIFAQSHHTTSSSQVIASQPLSSDAAPGRASLVHAFSSPSSTPSDLYYFSLI
jgi:hypothetical protein